MLVLTDGNENFDPLISDLPAGTINQTTFAIGFGLPGQVSDPILSQISANTGGYLLVTGDMTNDTERFDLAKFFIQVLKDATLNQTVVDPEGLLLWNGPVQEIPFQVSDTEVSIDVVVLSPLPVALDFRLITPTGKTITPALSGVEPNVRYVIGPEVSYYRLMLPVFPSEPAGSHRGTWKALLSLRGVEEVMADIRKMREEDRAAFAEAVLRLREFMEKAMPFNMTVYSYSNLTLDATLRQDGFAPGDAVHLRAKLWEYQLPMHKSSLVWADVLQPDGSREKLPFSASSDGAYTADWITSQPGVYKFVIRAEGRTTGNARFSREKILTAGVWMGGDQPYNPQTGKDGRTCELILCLLDQLAKSRELHSRLKSLGINLDALRKCVEANCRRRRPAMTELPEKIISPEELEAIMKSPEFKKMVEMVDSGRLLDVRLLEVAKTTPVVRKPKMKGVIGNLFVMPGQVKEKEHEGEEEHCDHS
jgi:hypothetical protein